MSTAVSLQRARGLIGVVALTALPFMLFRYHLQGVLPIVAILVLPLCLSVARLMTGLSTGGLIQGVMARARRIKATRPVLFNSLFVLLCLYMAAVYWSLYTLWVSRTSS